MRAIRLHSPGPPENLVLDEVPDPVPGEGQVGIRVGAAGVHVIDTALRAGRASGPLAGAALPTIPGREVAGVVDALGPGADPAWLGRRVVVHLGMVPGGYAERAVAAQASLHPIPDGLGDAEAVALIGTGRTTMGVVERSALSGDDVVAVTGAAGGIGGLIVQIAAARGATVIALAGGAAKLARARELGAHAAVDYTRDGWEDRVREAGAPTLAIDAVGGETGRALLSILAPGGRLAIVGWAPDAGPTRATTDDLLPRSLAAVVAVGPGALRGPGGLRGLEERALGLWTSGEVRRVPVQAFALEDAAAAHRAIEERRTMGKVVLVVR
ncbi:MAG: zinc-binding dehydrogenase [Thermoleophilia bacterium]